MRLRAWIVSLVGVPLIVAGTATHALAGQHWDIDVHVGALMPTNPTSGTSTLPAPGPDIPLNGPFPAITRRVPSWYFGDGASILNQILGPRSPVRIAPLDPILQSRIVERQAGASFGFRVDRSLTRRFGAEFALDEAQGQLKVRQATDDQVSASQASFLAVWNMVLNAPSAGLQVVTSDTTLDGKRGRQLVTSGALLINLLSSDTFTPYVAVGAGYIAARGGTPSIRLTGDYDFRLQLPIVLPTPPQLHFNDADNVTIQTVAENSFTWVFGGGAKYALGSRWGVRADLRDHVNRDVVRTTVTTTPKSASTGTTSTATFALAPNAPLLIFSSSPLALSTLSTTIADFQTFKGHGIVNQINASAGMFWRF